MSLNLIIFGIFFCILVIIAISYRNSTLDKLPFQPGENLLFEESGVRIEQEGSPESVIFINCIVRVTDQRIITAQKMLFSKKYALRHVITYTGNAPSTSLKATFRKGYLHMFITSSNVKITDNGENGIVRIEIPETALTRKQFVVFKTPGIKRYLKIFPGCEIVSI